MSSVERLEEMLTTLLKEATQLANRGVLPYGPACECEKCKPLRAARASILDLFKEQGKIAQRMEARLWLIGDWMDKMPFDEIEFERESFIGDAIRGTGLLADTEWLDKEYERVVASRSLSTDSKETKDG